MNKPVADSEEQYRRLSFWHDSLPGAFTARPALEGDVDADVAIIGAGYTGLWTAWYLRQLEPGNREIEIEVEFGQFAKL